MMVKYIFYFSYFLSYFTAALVVVSLRFPYIISKLIVYSIYIVNMFLLIYLLGKDELGKLKMKLSEHLEACL